VQFTRSRKVNCTPKKHRGFGPIASRRDLWGGNKAARGHVLTLARFTRTDTYAAS